MKKIWPIKYKDNCANCLAVTKKPNKPIKYVYMADKLTNTISFISYCSYCWNAHKKYTYNMMRLFKEITNEVVPIMRISEKYIEPSAIAMLLK